MTSAHEARALGDEARLAPIVLQPLAQIPDMPIHHSAFGDVVCSPQGVEDLLARRLIVRRG
jgi:hypothetical protein